ncbi:MAG: hypothetical protein WBN22_10025 [Verrucomicrobiia bacterium]
MRLAFVNGVGSAKQRQWKEQAHIRIIILALVSFLLGVAATALWFHFAASRNAEISSAQTGGPQTSEEPAAGQPPEPVIPANPPARPLVVSQAPVDAAAIAEVKQAIPNFASLSLEEGTQVLREAALKQFTAAAKEMDAQVTHAGQQLAQAENGQSAAGQQAAMKQVQETQAEQTEKLQQIAMRLQAQIAALEQLKGMTP